MQALLEERRSIRLKNHDVATITCPDDIEIETIAGDSYNVAKWTTPVYTVDNNIQGTVFCNYDSGSQFNIGSQMVECTVTLENGISSGCSFFVRVIDNEDPTIQCPANQIILSENGDPVTVNTDGPTYDDNSGAVTMYCSPHLSTTAFDIGLWEITCEAVDRSVNKAECTFGINIVAAASSDPCEGDTNQCNGRGVCLTTSTASKQYTCSCFEGWTGQFCQDTDYQDPCEGPGADGDYNWQCNQKGTCITTDITLGEYTCECYDGWIGDRCEESENENSESTTAVAGDGNGGDGNGDIDRENSAQSGLNTAIVAGGASGGLLIVIIILVAIIACFVVKGRRSKPSERTLSTHPLAASNGSQPENGKSPSVKKDGLENPSYSSHIDSRYSRTSNDIATHSSSKYATASVYSNGGYNRQENPAKIAKYEPVSTIPRWICNVQQRWIGSHIWWI
ncbi:uncharacterized protein [Amphiura filiformis]|uniref:uncharacterized protein n=1 Tax=Amphiura filiformis TaxID=82378 RepID=UPI003B223AD5